MAIKQFKLGKRYHSNKYNTTYLVTDFGALATATLQDDITGESKTYQILSNDKEEYIDLSCSNPDNVTVNSESVIRASRSTDYIAMSDVENKLLMGEEVEISMFKLQHLFSKGLLRNNIKIKAKLS